jgi:hypothetical protein
LTGAGGWVPRRLDEPRTLGRYINWLWREIHYHLAPEHTDLGKAMKRALALTRILFLEAQGEELLSLLRDQKLMLSAAIQARLDLRSKLHALGVDSRAPRFEAPLLQDIIGLVERLAEPGLAAPEKGATAEAIDSWCQRTKQLLDSATYGHIEVSQRLRSLVAELSGLL